MEAASADLPALPPPYRIEGVIAQGGMGRIYRALDTELGRAVAIKVPKTSSPALARRFEREVAITARLQHPGIVPVHGAGQLADGSPFYVMRFVEGTPLDVAVGNAEGIEQRLALLPRLVEICATMGYAHGERIAHRDLKPNNVLLGRFGETLIIDWGLAKQLEDTAARPSIDDISSLADPRGIDALDEVSASPSSTTRAGDVLGTPSFMSPEQASGKPVDVRADVYALGVILAFVVTGKIGTVDDDPVWRGAAAALVPIHRRATSATVADRYAHAGELADALRAALAKRAEAAPPRSRSPWPVVIAAGLAAAGSVVAIGIALRPPALVAAPPPPSPVTSPSGKLVFSNITRSDLGAIALSPSSQRLAMVSTDRVEVRDLASERMWTRPAWVAWPWQVQFEAEDVLGFTASAERGQSMSLMRWTIDSDQLTARSAVNEPGLGWFGSLATGADLYVDARPVRPQIRAGTAPPKRVGLGRHAVGMVAIAPDRRSFAFADPLDRAHVVITIVDAEGNQLAASPPLADATALTWADDRTVLYATGSTSLAQLWRATATTAGLAAPERVYIHEHADQWIGAIAARRGRTFVSIVTSAFEARVLDLATRRVDVLPGTDAAAVLAWRDADTLLTWNRGTHAIERRALSSGQLPAVTQAQFDGDPANVTTAGDTLLIAQRGAHGRSVVALAQSTGAVKWKADEGALWFVRCAGDRAPPCVAATRMATGDLELRRIDPETGTLGAVVSAPGNLIDAAIDASGTRLAWIADKALRVRALDAHDEGTQVPGYFGSAHSLAFIGTTDELVIGGGLDGRGIHRVRGTEVTAVAPLPNEIISLVRASHDGAHVSFRSRALTSQLAELDVAP